MDGGLEELLKRGSERRRASSKDASAGGSRPYPMRTARFFFREGWRETRTGGWTVKDGVIGVSLGESRTGGGDEGVCSVRSEKRSSSRALDWGGGGGWEVTVAPATADGGGGGDSST